jgi:probable addiction module antidote protein
MPIQTYSWDAADHLETKEDIVAYLEAALEDGDPSVVVAALEDIARSKGMTHIIQSLRQSSKFYRLLDYASRLSRSPSFAFATYSDRSPMPLP